MRPAFVSENSQTQPQPLYEAYRHWCVVNGHKPMSSTAVAAEWKRLGYEIAPRGRGIATTSASRLTRRGSRIRWTTRGTAEARWGRVRVRCVGVRVAMEHNRVDKRCSEKEVDGVRVVGQPRGADGDDVRGDVLVPGSCT